MESRFFFSFTSYTHVTFSAMANYYIYISQLNALLNRWHHNPPFIESRYRTCLSLKQQYISMFRLKVRGVSRAHSIIKMLIIPRLKRSHG